MVTKKGIKLLAKEEWKCTGKGSLNVVGWVISTPIESQERMEPEPLGIYLCAQRDGAETPTSFNLTNGVISLKAIYIFIYYRNSDYTL